MLTLRHAGALSGHTFAATLPGMPEQRPVWPGYRDQSATVVAAALAGRHWGVVSRRELIASGVSTSAISRATASGRLHVIHPGVYAVGHAALGIEGRLVAALLYAGPGAALSHLTAAWWWGLLPGETKLIHVSVAGRRKSPPGVRVHRTREVSAVKYRGFPVTTAARTLLEISPSLPSHELRKAIAEAEYRRLIDVGTLDAADNRGHRGAARLRRAVRAHLPQLAQTRSTLEERFLHLCEKAGLPLPEVNVVVAGLTVDCLWREAGLIVELDGKAAHGSHSAMERDRGRDMQLRAQGYAVFRYTWGQVTRESAAVVQDLRTTLSPELWRFRPGNRG
jgi:hypothetical protein